MGDILGEGSYAKVKEAIDSQNLVGSDTEMDGQDSHCNILLRFGEL